MVETLLALILATLGVVLVILVRKPKPEGLERQLTDQFQSQREALLEKLANQAQSIRELTDQSLDRHFKNVDGRLLQSSTTSNNLLKDLSERLKITEVLDQRVATLNQILTNKQERGAFGELRLEQIVKDQLPTSFYEFQATLPKGDSRVIADCLIKLPAPSKPICVDAKFPLPEDGEDREEAFRSHLRRHVKDISEKYIIGGVTDEKAILFLPSEGLYGLLCSGKFAGLIDEARKKGVLITSPNTMWFVLNAVASLIKDAQIYEQAKQLQKQVAVLGEDSRRLSQRWEKLRTHFDQTNRNLDEVGTSVTKITSNSDKITQLDFEDRPKLK